MGNPFLIVDKLNAVARECIPLLSFNFENNGYLIYCFSEGEGKYQLLISRFDLLDNGKYYISEILSDFRKTLNDFVYNLIISIPSDTISGKKLLDDFCNKNNITISNNVFSFEEQKYYFNSSVAVTSGSVIKKAISFYKVALLNDSFGKKTVSNSVWTVPTPINLNEEKGVQKNNDIDNNSSVLIPNLPNFNEPNLSISSTEENSSDILNYNANVLGDMKLFNFQMADNNNVNKNHTSDDSIQNIDVTSTYNVISNFNNSIDASSQIKIESPNLENSTEEVKFNISNSNAPATSNAGFVSNKYIIIGIISLVLATLVVIYAIMLVRGM